MSHFRIKATPENISHAQSFPSSGNGYAIGNATAVVNGKWIEFTLHTHTAALFSAGSISKKGYLKQFNF